MTKAEFHNALRIMRSIDRHELIEAGMEMTPGDGKFPAFRDDPCGWFIRASDADADVIWTIIKRRQTR